MPYTFSCQSCSRFLHTALTVLSQTFFRNGTSITFEPMCWNEMSFLQVMQPSVAACSNTFIVWLFMISRSFSYFQTCGSTKLNIISNPTRPRLGRFVGVVGIRYTLWGPKWLKPIIWKRFVLDRWNHSFYCVAHFFRCSSAPAGAKLARVVDSATKDAMRTMAKKK